MNYNICIQGNSGKKILVIGCIHGDELIGQKVINKLRKLTVSRGTLTTVIANMRAKKAGKRFIDQDLNRSFPGNPKGNHEERLAHDLLSLIKKADIVLDIHSTTADTTSTIILTKVNQSIRRLLSVFSPRRVVVMEKKVGETALTGHCKAGISFEYGKDNSEKAYKKTFTDIVKILEEFGMITEKKNKLSEITHKAEYFQVFGTFERLIGFKLKKTIKNFSLVRYGEIVAR
ncbi:MAG: succinylglutamate desuccinylase/aspartoacylase, partial [uncultured bacterium]